jgi:glutamyl-tRNA reductase
MQLLLLGVNHRTAPVEVRETLFFGPEEARALLRQLRGDGLDQAMVLSTCNRTELYAFTSDPPAAEDRLRALVSRIKGADLLSPSPHRYTQGEGEAARHLFRVAAGLDSMVLGEMQILGQVKDAHALAREEGTGGVLLDRLLGSAVHAGKRARTETAISAGVVSVASAAVALAMKVFGDLSRGRVLVVGAGETGGLAARHFAEKQPSALWIVNRTRARADALAGEVQGASFPLSEIGDLLLQADVVVCATGAPGHLITAGAVRRAMGERPHRPLVLVDLGVPRNVDPEGARQENVFLYSIDTLRAVADQNLARRQREVPRVEAIVEEECDRFLAWFRGLEATPVLRELRDHFERLRAEEVGKSLRQFAPHEQEQVDRLTRSLVNRLLHLPTTRLKALDLGSEAGLSRLHALRDLFALGGEPGEGKRMDGGT